MEQPRDLNAEAAVLSAMMVDSEGLNDGASRLKAKEFFNSKHRLIFNALLDIMDEAADVDIIVVINTLKKNGNLERAGGMELINDISDIVMSSSNISSHIKIVKEKYRQRELMALGQKLMGDAAKGEVDSKTLSDVIFTELMAAQDTSINKGLIKINDIFQKTIENTTEVIEGNAPAGLNSGIVDLDIRTGGFKPGNFILIAGRPAAGKSVVGLEIAINVAKKGGVVAVFNLEMDGSELVNRGIGSITNFEYTAELKKGHKHVDVEKISNIWEQAAEVFADMPLYINDAGSTTVASIRAESIKLKLEKGKLDMILIDYLQLMGGANSNNRQQEIADISRGLKLLAKELKCPIVALSQLNRGLENRDDKRPRLSDLRECLHGDSIIYLPEKGEYKKISELIGLTNFKVLSKTVDHKLINGVCEGVWEAGKKDIYELITQSGFNIKASKKHKFYTANSWERLGDIKIGTHIATARELPCVEDDNPAILDEEIVILAHMIGDGCYCQGQPIHYTSEDNDSLNIVEKYAKFLWGCKTRRIKDPSSKQCWHLYMPSPYSLTHGIHNPFINLIYRLGLRKGRSYEKTIPNTIFESSKRQISLFLNHLWATDGGVSNRKKGGSKFHYSSTSLKMITQIKSLLLRFGITSSFIKTQKGDCRPCYILSITGKENILKFANSIGIFGSKANEVKILTIKMEGKESNPNSDVIPKEYWDAIKIKRKEKGFTERSFQAELEMSYCGSSLYKSNMSRGRLSRISNILKSEELTALAESDIKWDKVVSVKKVGREMTYDLTVRDYHNFVSNDIIVHNSGSLEQDADLVVFVYRDVVYNEDTENPEVMELITAKFRAGNIGTDRVWFHADRTSIQSISHLEFKQMEGFNERKDEGERSEDEVGRTTEELSEQGFFQGHYSEEVKAK
jgi:replicative DNA helicase